MTFRLFSFVSCLLIAPISCCSPPDPQRNDVSTGISTQWVRHIPNNKDHPSEPGPDIEQPFKEPLPENWIEFYVVLCADEGLRTSIVIEILDGSHRCVVYHREESAPYTIVDDGPGKRMAVVRFPKGPIRLKVTEHTTGQFLEKDIDLGDAKFLQIVAGEKYLYHSLYECYPGRE